MTKVKNPFTKFHEAFCDISHRLDGVFSDTFPGPGIPKHRQHNLLPTLIIAFLGLTGISTYIIPC
jgi:hypothetical protein